MNINMHKMLKRTQANGLMLPRPEGYHLKRIFTLNSKIKLFTNSTSVKCFYLSQFTFLLKI